MKTDSLKSRQFALSKVAPEFVAIGCSAGGIEALNRILPYLPADFPSTIGIVLHISQDSESVLAELFRTKCKVRVKEAEDKEPIQRGTVYFAPPNYHLLVEKNRTFSLSVDEPVQFSRPSVDVLMESAAFAFGKRASGIILTGANADGATGLHCIWESGGLAIVQNPATAEQPNMPNSAIEGTPESFVLTLEEICAWLSHLQSASDSEEMNGEG